MIFKLVLFFISTIIIPTILGLLITKFIKERNNLCLAFVVGHLMQFVVCQLLAVPMIFARFTFKTLYFSYVAIISIFAISSIFINRKNLKEIIIDRFKSLKKFPKLLTVIVIILIVFQVYALVGYMHEDADDAFYIATATTSVQTNSLFKYAAQDGVEYGKDLPLRYVLGPFPIYYALYSEIINIHPAIFAHTVLPAIFIPFAYLILGLLGNEVFEKDKKKVMLFLIILSITYIWGNYSIKNNFTFLLFRIWQGKAVLANIIIPAVWLVYLIAKKCEFKLINYILIGITILAGTFTTTMGIALPTLSLMLLCIADELSQIDLKNMKIIEHLKKIIKCLLCCVPALIYLVIYFA